MCPVSGRLKKGKVPLMVPVTGCSWLLAPEGFSCIEFPDSVFHPGFTPKVCVCRLLSPVPRCPGLWLSLAPGVVEYLHSLVIHSESSRQEAPMGLRETPLQKGVILRSLLFAELSSGIGEPSTCRAKTDSPQIWKSRPCSTPRRNDHSEEAVG